MSDRARTRQTRPRVHPRTVWIGVAICILGMSVVAAGMVSGSSAAAGGGVLLTGAGLVVAWHGGILRDVRTSGGVREEAEQAREGESHPGVPPGGRLPRTPASSRETESAESQRVRSKTLPERASAFPSEIAPTVLLVLAAWTFVSQAVLAYPYTVLGQDTALRSTGIAAVLALSALYLRQVGPGRLAIGLCLASGAALVLSGALLPHSTTRGAWNELVTGALVLLAAAVAGSRRRATQRTGPGSGSHGGSRSR